MDILLWLKGRLIMVMGVIFRVVVHVEDDEVVGDYGSIGGG